MAVLEKIRVKLGVLITVLIAVALLSFIIDPGTLETTLSYFSSKYDVGKIDGKKVRYNEFQKEVDYYTNIYTLTTGSQSVSEEAMQAINESAWQNLISEWYVIPQMQKAGIRVGDDELASMLPVSSAGLSFWISYMPFPETLPAIWPLTGVFCSRT